jgi:hypothetical protein
VGEAATDVLGVKAEDLDDLVSSLSPEEAEDLLYLVVRALGAEEDGQGIEIVEAGLPGQVDNINARHFRAVDKLTSDLEAGKISLDKFDRGMHDSITTNFRDAYSVGRGKLLDAGDEEYLSRAVDTELGYARKFGRDIKEKRLRMPRTQRAAMYGNTVEGIAWNAKVESFPDGALIGWLLGNAEHCTDCLILASQSPFTKQTLPTTPRAGGTICRSRCKCRLTVKKGRLTRAEREQAEMYGEHRGETLAEMLTTPPPPKGMRLPTIDERLEIDRLRARINYNRRLIATSKDKGKVREAIFARKRANKELIEFLDKTNVYEVPLWSVDEVITSADIGMRAEADIFRHGIDGATLDLLTRREIRTLIARYERELGEKFEDLEKYKRPKLGKGQKAEAEEEDGEERRTEYSLVAKDLPSTFTLLGQALLVARGKDVQVGPLSDQLLSMTYLWVKGPHAADVVGELEDSKIDFVAVPVEIARRREKDVKIEDRGGEADQG